MAYEKLIHVQYQVPNSKSVCHTYLQIILSLQIPNCKAAGQSNFLISSQFEIRNSSFQIHSLSVSSVCVCLWQTAYPFTTTKSPNSWSSWDSGAQGVTKGVKTDTITGAVVSVIVVTGIIVTVCGACGYKRRARRRATTTGTHVTLMTHVDTTNLPPGAYPVQHRVSYTANQAGVPLVSQPMSVQQNMQQQPIPDSMQVPSYDSALSYPTPNHTADETSESEPPLYSVETDHQTSPTTESSTRHTDSSDITHSGGSASPDQEATSLPPSYDQLYS